MGGFVEVRDLTKRYGEVTAVDHLSFHVNEGEIFGLLGPNGAGKSTTLNVLTTLTDFNRGEIEISGYDIHKERMKIKAIVGLVPQEVALYPYLSALENVKFFASLYGLKGSRLTEVSKEALEFVGLLDRAGMKPKKMSGGMKRRLNIACGIAHGPRLIVMDEPTVGVDAQSREHILKSILKLRDRGATIIYTSHYMQEVEEICDRIAIVDRGKLIACGSKGELVSLVTDIQTVYIETRIPYDFDMEAFIKKHQMLSGVKNIKLEDNVIRIDLSIQHHSINQVIGDFIQWNLPIINIKTEVPNLETLFITLTGKELR